MATYTKAPTDTLKHGDVIVFKTPKGYLTGKAHLGGFVDFSCSNREIFRQLGIADPEAFCAKAYGYASCGGIWPQCKEGDWAALTRAVRAVLKRCKPMSKADAKKLAEAERCEAEKAKADAEAAAKKAAEEAKRAALPKPAKDFLAHLDAHPDAFGCQRRHVVATVGAILGVDLSGAV